MIKSRILATVAGFACSLVFAPEVSLAGIPDLAQKVVTVPVTFPNGTTLGYTLYRDYDGENILHVKPESLAVDRDSNGEPACRVVLIRDIANPNEQNDTVASGGWIYLQARIGFENQSSVFDLIKTWIDANRPQLSNHTLASLGFLPGTGTLTVELAGGNEAFENKMITVPAGATTTVGGIVNVMVPLTTSHAASINQMVQAGDGSGNDLGVTLHYQANALFGVPPRKVKVTAKKEETFHYFQEKSSVNAGFWVFSYNDERTKIVEDFKTKGLVTTEIDFGIAALNEDDELLRKIAESYENSIVDQILNLSVDRTSQTPNAKPTIKEGRTTIYSPGFYWSYTSYFAGAYGSVTIDKTLDAYAERTFTEKRKVIQPVRLTSDKDFEVKPSRVRIVNLNTSFEKTEVALISNFSDAGAVYGKYLDNVQVNGVLPNGDPVNWAFTPNSLEDKRRVFFRDAEIKRFERSFGGRQFFVYGMTIPPKIDVKATMTANGYTVESEKTLTRSIDRFGPLETTLQTFFTPFNINADLLFERFGDSLGGPFKIEGVLHVADGDEDRAFELTQDNPEARFYFATGDGFGDGSTLRFKLLDAVSSHEFGDPIEIESAPTSAFNVVAQQIGGLSNSDAFLISAEDLILFLANEAPGPFRIKGRLKVGNTGEFQSFTLSKNAPSVSVKFKADEGFGNGSFLQFKMFDAINLYDWGPEVPIESVPTDRHDINGASVGGFSQFFGL